MSRSHPLVWLDLEMTGLDPERHVILEIATLITDSELNLLAEGPVIAIQQSDIELAKMDDWCTQTHGQSGLTERVKQSRISALDAEEQTIAFLKQWVKSGESPLCGNSIGQDRRFLVRYMPRLADYFHYRNLDVSTLKILAELWAPKVKDSLQKQGTHRALDDIRESIAELAHYRKHLLKV